MFPTIQYYIPPTPRDDGVLIPLGPGVDTGVHNPHGYTLNYNGKGVDNSLDTVMLYWSCFRVCCL